MPIIYLFIFYFFERVILDDKIKNYAAFLIIDWSHNLIGPTSWEGEEIYAQRKGFFFFFAILDYTE